MVSRRAGILRRPSGLVAGVRADPRLMAEWIACHPGVNGVAGFERFCAKHVSLYAKDLKRFVPFAWFAGQRRIAEPLVAGRHVIGLKARQLGFTELVVSWVLSGMTYRTHFEARAILQEKPYAKDFVARVRSMNQRLPLGLRNENPETDNTEELSFRGADGGLRRLRALVGSSAAGRSITGDIIIIDEAAWVRGLAETVGAVMPALEVAGGQLVVISTSDGPTGDFFDLWTETYGEGGELVGGDGVGPSGFVPIFLPWWERDGRDSSWYATERERLDRLSPVRVRREYPATVDEAWSAAEGRVWPLFTRETHVRELALNDDHERYRAIDWGQGESAYVVLWIAHLPGPPGLFVSPKCPNTIREILAYRWDPDHDGRVIKEHDHTCDALRYVVVTFGLTGTVYVYREVYRTHQAEKGRTFLKDIREIHELSGWAENHQQGRSRWRRQTGGERFVSTVADRSWPEMINQFNSEGIPCVGQRVPKRKGGDDAVRDDARHEVLEGIQLVNVLVDGTERFRAADGLTVLGTGAAVESMVRRREAQFGGRIALDAREAGKQNLWRELLAAHRELGIAHTED